MYYTMTTKLHYEAQHIQTASSNLTYNPPDSNTDKNGKWTLVEYFTFPLQTANQPVFQHFTKFQSRMSYHLTIIIINIMSWHYPIHPKPHPPHQVWMLHVLAGHTSCNTEYSTVLWAKFVFGHDSRNSCYITSVTW